MLDERTFALALKDGEFTVEAGDVRRQGDLFPLSLPYSLIHPPGQGLSHHIESPIAKKWYTIYNVLQVPKTVLVDDGMNVLQSQDIRQGGDR